MVVLGSIFIEKFLALLSLKFTPMKSTLVVVKNCEIRPEYISPREENEKLLESYIYASPTIQWMMHNQLPTSLITHLIQKIMQL